MSKSQTRRIKIQDPHTASWLESLSGPQVRALSHQHGVDGALTREIETLRGDLILLPSVREVAAGFKVEETCENNTSQ